MTAISGNTGNGLILVTTGSQKSLLTITVTQLMMSISFILITAKPARRHNLMQLWPPFSVSNQAAMNTPCVAHPHALTGSTSICRLMRRDCPNLSAVTTLNGAAIFTQKARHWCSRPISSTARHPCLVTPCCGSILQKMKTGRTGCPMRLISVPI